MEFWANIVDDLESKEESLGLNENEQLLRIEADIQWNRAMEDEDRF